MSSLIFLFSFTGNVLHTFTRNLLSHLQYFLPTAVTRNYLSMWCIFQNKFLDIKFDRKYLDRKFDRKFLSYFMWLFSGNYFCVKLIKSFKGNFFPKSCSFSPKFLVNLTCLSQEIYCPIYNISCQLLCQEVSCQIYVSFIRNLLSHL